MTRHEEGSWLIWKPEKVNLTKTFVWGYYSDYAQAWPQIDRRKKPNEMITYRIPLEKLNPKDME